MVTDITHFEVLPLRTLPDDVLKQPEIDLALVWQDASPFQDFEGTGGSDADHDAVLITFELMPGHDPTSLDDLLGPGDEVHDCWQGVERVIGTAVLSKATCARWLSEAGRRVVARFEAGLVWRDQRPGPRQHHSQSPPGGGAGAAGTLVAAGSVQDVPAAGDDLWIVVDDGCPWARSDLRLPSGGSRLRSLWYQRAAGSRIPDDEALPHPWGGLQWDTHGVNTWLRRVGADPVVAYAQWGDAHLQRRTSHGAQVLDLLLKADEPPSPSPTASVAGPSPTVAPPAPGTSARFEPTGPDLVFVQLPERMRSTVSRAALTPWVLEGVAHGLRFVGRSQRAVVNLSLESYDGPHDGSSLFEAGVQALIEHARQRLQVQLRVVLAAGNAHERQVAQALDLLPESEGVLHWLVPPGSERASWLELWCPEDQPLPHIRVAAPGLAPSPALEAGRIWTWPSRQSACCAVILPSAPRRGGRLVWIRLAPTQVFQPGEPAAPCGDWRILLRSPTPMRVHAYLARVWSGDGARPSGRQGRLWVAGVPAGDLQPQKPVPSGTISGLACGGPDVTVVGACWARDTNAAGGASEVSYSGQGPARGGWRAGAPAVDALAPGESGRGLPGVRSTGHLDGSSPRMGGTSMAVPQLARRLEEDGSQETPPP
jgi:hypothetical protein